MYLWNKDLLSGETNEHDSMAKAMKQSHHLQLSTKVGKQHNQKEQSYCHQESAEMTRHELHLHISSIDPTLCLAMDTLTREESATAAT